MKKYKGFTLIEIVLISAVISGILIAVCNLHLRAININNTSKDKEEAFYIARSACEICRSQDIEIPDGIIFYADDNYELINKFGKIIKEVDINLLPQQSYKKYRIEVKRIDGSYLSGVKVSVFNVNKDELIISLVSIR
ncbi:MAG: prepilin-type N-terminal cleavage/methylation domain-containing protein [Caloramator sp.]|nr:prepilin-type N-terminal cleavage/methylation domain-containing protein [Caloramator sp.]